MDLVRLFFAVLGILALGVNAGGSGSCMFPAIYNFGDSNSDTGAISAAIEVVPPPNGESFFGHSSGRFSDGRLIIDFIAEKLQLPYLSPYLDSLGTNFRHGANFATGGSSIRPGGYSPFHLGIQVSQFIRFKSQSIALYKQHSSNTQRLPRPEDFSKALYTIDIGQNDLAFGFQHGTIQQVQASIPDILTQLDQAMNKLYKEGARFFWVHNTGPHGCLPYNVIYDKSKPGNLDRIGCVKPTNEVAQEFNRQLKNSVLHLRKQLPLAVFTYVDVYSAKYTVISNAKNEGFVDPFDFCCGSYKGYHIDCGKKAIVNGTVYGNPCNNPSRHISWDGIHYSQAANILLANQIINGSLSDPPVSITEACHG
ncbi:putative alpha-L-fucosidase [Rosa chinensis]|uniref:Putative alpha-L-fucosidase n=1 Tax=Rosa chinensis TaxID=74649 RepID=A0A2P6S5F6_ROSCH|nr:GDSL esterase/lipase At3g27950 [Rosa chinensis]PRQ53906.1 putative alpha-L-fucosidase [Rosa chinensis]